MVITGNLAIVLGGGRGSRLYPLTKERCKPAVPLGGKYRLIDIPISNCINSGLRNIYIVSQFQSASLNQHIARAYNMDVFSSGFVSVLAASQTDSGMEDWFQGTADAVRKCLALMNAQRYKRVVILSGDQLYKMNYQDLLRTHLTRNADITISVLPVTRDKVEGFGIMNADEQMRITDFVEKPKDPDVVERFRVEGDPDSPDAEGEDKNWLASMGIYVFETEVLLDALADKSKVDFGKDIIPDALGKYKAVAHKFSGYWEDIGTIGGFFEANILLGAKEPVFDFFGGEQERIYTKQRFLAASRFMGARISESVISDGCLVDEGTEIRNSVIGIRSTIGKNALIEQAIVMGADSSERYGTPDHSSAPGVCSDVVIKRAILDKNVRIGRGAKIINKDGAMEKDGEGYYIREGVVVIPKNTEIPPGTII